MIISVQTLANAINEKRYITPEEIAKDNNITINNKRAIIEEYVYQNGEKIGYITLKAEKARYIIEFYLFCVSVPADIMVTDDYFNALHKFTIMRNKYSY